MLTFIIEIEVLAEIMRNLWARNWDMEHCPKYNYFLKRKKSASEGGGHWDFRFCGFGYFLDRFFGFYSRKRRFLGLGVHCGLRIFRFLASGFRFSQKYLISDAVFGFSCLTYFGSGFSPIWTAITCLHWSRIAAKHKFYRDECVTNQLKYRRDP